MAKSIPSGIKIEYDDDATTPNVVDITSYILTVNDVTVEDLQEDSMPLGASYGQSLPVGIQKMEPIELGGEYDDASNGPDDLFIRTSPETPSSVTRTLKFTWRSGKTTEVETYRTSYTRSADRAGLTKFKVKLQPTGTITET